MQGMEYYILISTVKAGSGVLHVEAVDEPCERGKPLLLAPVNVS